MTENMILIDVDGEIKKLYQQLDKFPKDATSILRNAINATARKVRKQIVMDAQGEYTIRNKTVFEKPEDGAPKVNNARESNMTAFIRSTGPMRDIMDFLTSPNTKTEAAAAQVLNAGMLKPLEKNGIKAFIARFQSGHVAIVQRTSKASLPIKKLLSPSVPHMLQNEEVRKKAEELTHATLQAEIEKRVSKLMKAKGA